MLSRSSQSILASALTGAHWILENGILRSNPASLLRCCCTNILGTHSSTMHLAHRVAEQGWMNIQAFPQAHNAFDPDVDASLWQDSLGASPKAFSYFKTRAQRGASDHRGAHEALLLASRILFADASNPSLQEDCFPFPCNTLEPRTDLHLATGQLEWSQ